MLSPCPAAPPAAMLSKIPGYNATRNTKLSPNVIGDPGMQMPTCQLAYMPPCHHANMPTCLHANMPTCQRAVSSSITAPQYYRGRFNPKKLYRGCGVRLRCLLRCAGVVCSMQVRCAACRCGVQLIVVRDFLCLWHSSEDNLGDKTSRTSPGGGTMLQE